MVAAVRRALEGAGAEAVDGSAGDALVLVGGLESRCFLDFGAGVPGAVQPAIAAAVRNAHAEGRWIAAPGVAAAAALKALEPEIAAGRANRHRSEEGVAIFPDLRLICLERPMQCEIETERDAAIAQLVTRLVSEAAATA